MRALRTVATWPRPILAAALSASLVACTSGPPRGVGVPEVQHTWDHARVYAPGRFLATVPAQLQASGRMPVVVYLHGCTGLTPHDAYWARTLITQGVIVIQPDSFARTDRRANCDPATHRVGLFPPASAMRDEELRFALERLRSVPWADPQRIIVMGHSEGGRAAMANVAPNVRGTIVSGWGCTSSNWRWNGIPHPAEHPLLILEHDHDPWYAKRGGRCKDHLAGRSATKYVALGGSGHNSAHSEQAREAALAFVGAVLR